MNPIVGWALAAVVVALSWQAYRWPGLVLAVTVVVFWLLLQFNRTLRVMKNAAGAPVGHVDSAVMLNAKLKRGMTLMQVIALTKSLGRRVAETPETWAWVDASGSSVTLLIESGRLSSWTLDRPAAP